MNLDDFIRIGGEYSPCRIVRRHIWGWECEYTLSHPSITDDNITATVVIYKYGGRYIISDHHFDNNTTFFDNVFRIYKETVMRRRDSKKNIRINIMRLLCSTTVFILRTIFPLYEFIVAIKAMAGADMYSACLRIGIGVLSILASFYISQIRVWLLGVGAMNNSDLDVMMKEERAL